MTDRKNNLFILCILLVGIALRVSGLQIQSLSMDEALEINIAGLPLLEIIFRQDGFPPLYHIILSAWMDIFPGAESARWLSVVFGCMTIPVMYKLGYHLGKKKNIGLWAAILLAVSPFHIWYSQETRAYALFCLVATSALYFFFKAMDDDRRRNWLLFAMFAIIGVYTHYFFVILLMSCGLIAVVERHSWNAIRSVFFSFLLIGLFCLPSLVLLQGDLNLQENWLLKRPFDLYSLLYTYYAFLGGLSIGPSIRELHVPLIEKTFHQLLLWAIFLSGILSMLGIATVRTIEKGKMAIRLLVLIILPLLICGVLSQNFQVGFNVRYVVWVAVPVYIFLAIGLAEGVKHVSVRFALIALVCFFSLSIYNRRVVGRYMNEDVRAVAGYIMAHSGKGTPVLVQHKSEALPLTHYLDEAWPVYSLETVKKDGEGLNEVISFLKKKTDHAKFWLLYTRPFHGDPAGIFKKSMLKNGVIQKQGAFSGIEVYTGKFPKS